MYHKPKISVIIPVYNSEKYLQKCFDSVRNQSVKELEIIFVDDGSTDKSSVLLQQYKMEDNRVTVHTHSKNRGLGQARNTAMSKAQGEYLFFLDSDDYIHPNALEVLYEYAREHNLDILQAQFVKHQNDKKQVLPVDLMNFPQTITGVSYLNSGVFIEPKACVKLWKTDFVLQHNLQFASGYYEDVLMVFEAYSLAQRVNAIPVPVYHYVHRQDSITGQQFTPKHVKDFQTAMEGLQAFFMKPEISSPTSVFPAMMMLYLVQLCTMAQQTGKKDLLQKVKQFNQKFLKRYKSILRKNKRLSFVKKHFISHNPCLYARLKAIKLRFI